MKIAKIYQTYQNLCDAMKTMFIMIFIALNVNIRKCD